MERKFTKGAEASAILRVSQNTLRSYTNSGKISYVTLPSGQRRYDVTSLMKKENKPNRKCVCYCRVSTHDQCDDLERQKEYMEEKYPDYEIITDIGSGVNFQRPGLIKLIDYSISGVLDTLVVAYKDRLCRIGYGLIEHLMLKYSNTNIIIELNNDETANEAMANDILQIITVYSAKINGMRSYKKDENSL